MAPSKTYDIEGIDLLDDSYMVEQGFVRNKYEALDADGNTVLRGKQKLLALLKPSIGDRIPPLC